MQSMSWSLLMLLAVLCLIPLCLGALKRLQGAPGLQGLKSLKGLAALRGFPAQRPMDIVAQLQLGPRERVLLVRVHERTLVLGVTAHQVSLLGETRT